MSARGVFRLNSLAILAKQRCAFHYNSIRTRSIFNLFDYLNRAHFKLQNESLIVSFTYWVQILLTCEIDEVAEGLRDPDLSGEDFAILSDLALTLKPCAKFF